jgi:hypothetical protein
MPKRVGYEHLTTADLTLGTVFEQGSQPNFSREPLHRLLPGVGNQGGRQRPGGDRQAGGPRFEPGTAHRTKALRWAEISIAR